MEFDVDLTDPTPATTTEASTSAGGAVPTAAREYPPMVGSASSSSASTSNELKDQVWMNEQREVQYPRVAGSVVAVLCESSAAL